MRQNETQNGSRDILEQSKETTELITCFQGVELNLANKLVKTKRKETMMHLPSTQCKARSCMPQIYTNLLRDSRKGESGTGACPG